MKYTLRPYQQEMVDLAVKELNRDKPKPFVLQAGTGAGKSLVIAGICHQLPGKTLVLQPSRELLKQNYDKMLSYDIKDVKIYSASLGKKEIGNYVMATIGSIYKKPELFKDFEYVIIDECDLVNPKEMDTMYKKFLTAIGCNNVCGLTATPYRTVSKFYTDEWGGLFYTAHLKCITRIGYPTFWKGIKYKIETQELIDDGYLSPIKYYIEPSDISKLKVNTTGADFTVDSLEAWGAEKVARICQAIEYARDNHKRALVFCSSLRQANAVLDAFSGDSSYIQLVDGKTPKKEREEAVRLFKTGDRPVMLNVGVFLAGFDVPELDCIIFARPTLSLRVWYQAVGRGVRLDPGAPEKVLHVYDLAGVTESLGRVETIQVRREAHGFRDEVWSERGRMDETPLFNWFVKNNKFKGVKNA